MQMPELLPLLETAGCAKTSTRRVGKRSASKQSKDVCVARAACEKATFKVQRAGAEGGARSALEVWWRR